MSQRIVSTMRSFAGGQLNNGARRRDETEEYRTGARVMSDWRIEETETLVPRPGRRLLAQTGCPRVEYIRLGSTDYALGFGNGSITVLVLATGAVAARAAGYAWTAATVGSIYFCVAENQIVICFPGAPPQVIFYAPSTSAFTFAPFAFRDDGVTSQQPFYRTGNLGATMSWTNVQGAIVLTCSQPYFTPALAGRILSLLGQQVVLGSYISPTQMNATVRGRLPDSLILGVASVAPFQLRQIVEDNGDTLKLEVSAVNAAANQVGGTLLNVVIASAQAAPSNDILVSPLGSSAITSRSTAAAGTSVQWQEQFMGAGIGWPMACAYDKGRLVFFDFPQRPGAILWSAVGQYDVFWIDAPAATLQPAAGAQPSSAILEFIPGNPRVRHIIGSGDEFVFTDRGIFYVPISSSQPLQPGSVEFRRFSSDGVGGIVPVEQQNSIVYINAGGKHATMIQRTGGYTTPYATADVADMHTDLFTGPVALAIAQGSGQVPERLIYVLNADGSIVHGKISRDNKLVGWLPWYSAQAPTWLFSSGATVFYCVPLAGSSWLAQDDVTLFLDSVATPNALPSSFPPPPPGAGPLYVLQGATVTCMSGLLDLGERMIDSNGNLVLGDDDDPAVFGAADLAVGFIFTPKLQPFVPAAQPGASQGQRQHRRSITRGVVSAEQSSGFTLGAREVPAYRLGDDATSPPPLYDETVQVRPLGRSFDPGLLLMKPRPGPLRIIEYVTEATA